MGATLVIGHHFNRKRDAARQDRLSGAGLVEWARLVITLDAPPPRPGASTVDIETSNPELAYGIEVLREGADAVAAAAVTTKDRAWAAFGAGNDAGATVAEITERVKADGKRHVKDDTVKRALGALRDRGQAESDGGKPALWWRPDLGPWMEGGDA